MTIRNFKIFLNNLILETLHPELQSIVKNNTNNISKHSQISKKIRELSARGESTGIEGNMPKGSSRAYLKHAEPHEIELDGKKTTIKTGTKVAIKSSLDRFHDKTKYDDMNLGNMQNHAENGDHFANRSYRVLTDHGNNKFTTNENGIFPPLIEHDHDNHEWSHVGHVRDIKGAEFMNLTAMKGYSKGISHRLFVETLNRFHTQNHGKYWKSSEIHEKKLDKVEQHPLVQKFINYHGTFGAPPNDYSQIKNLGVFEHPNGSKHIVARDHGFSLDVQKAYQDARRKKYSKNW